MIKSNFLVIYWLLVGISSLFVTIAIYCLFRVGKAYSALCDIDIKLLNMQWGINDSLEQRGEE